MNNLTQKQKIGLLGFLLYTIIIGIGMFTSFHINGNDYASSKLVNTLWYFEIILTVLTVFITIKYFSWKNVGFQKLNLKQFLWFLPSTIIILFMWGGLFQHISLTSISKDQWSLFALVGFTTLLVGFSEELMFRGVVLHSFLQTKSKMTSIFVSAITFALIHSVNIFAGLTFVQTCIQLIFTFLFGLYVGLIQIRIKNIIPLILFHWLWDFFLIGGKVILHEEEVLTVVHLFVEVIMIVILLILLKREKNVLNIEV